MSTSPVQRLLANIAPGDRLDFDDIHETERHEFIKEFEGQGFVLSGDSVVGQVETCPACDGEGQLPGARPCRKCNGYSLVVDFGRGTLPYDG